MLANNMLQDIRIKTSHQARIVVVGSSSLDLVINSPRIPVPGDTLMAIANERFFGGKGANQAVACARLGATVHFISCVGMEPVGQQILRHLVDEGINVGYVRETENAESGRAYVVAAENQNTIMVVPAANQELNPYDVRIAEKFIEKANILLVQLEIPMPVVQESLQLARKHQIPSVLYASPAVALPTNVLENTDFIVAKINDVQTLFNQNIEEILTQNPNKIFVRTEQNTTIYHDGQSIKEKPRTAQSPMHTMGMGDAFTAAFAMAIIHQNSVEQSVAFGNEIAYMVSQQRGSQRGLPKWQNLDFVLPIA